MEGLNTWVLEGVAVRRAARDFRGPDHAAAAALVLHDNGAEQGLHPVGPQPADHVGCAAGREGDDEADVALGIGEGRERGKGGGSGERSCHKFSAMHAIRSQFAGSLNF
jgi:hypothetical protein